MSIKSCPLCGEQSNSSHDGRNDIYDCPICGSYSVDFRARSSLSKRSDKTSLSGVCREQSDSDNPVIFTDKNLDQWASLAPRSTDVEAKAHKLLSFVAGRSAYPGDWVKFSARCDRSTCFASNAKESGFLIDYLKDRKWIKCQVVNLAEEYTLTVLAEGWAEVQNSKFVKSSQAFVAMWFSDEMLTAYEHGLRVGIRSSGYEARRIDFEQFNSKIDDEIIAEIRRSTFLIADVTGGRNGVFFEAGFAMGLGLPVIWTCRKGDEAFMHFDTRQYNHIIWKSNDDLAEQLELRIRATIGQGPLDVEKLLKDDHGAQ